ncbi:hypothetical protein [Agrococcus sp. KRD186]|uniref:hypothetical protein n=1 Tax=Agrococcus sp. KRD186 TaxID=2729730 RepID=UPI0019D13406|nr:hypothetical protein [Agrococcus sp. KRD186]
MATTSGVRGSSGNSPTEEHSNDDPAPARTRSHTATTIAIGERDREWQATTDEAISRIDHALTTTDARADTVADGDTRGHITGHLAAALTVLERLADSPPVPPAGSDEHPH